WNLKSGCLQTILEGEVRHVALSANGRLALTAEREINLNLWDTSNGTLVRTIICEDTEVHQVALSADGRVAAIASHHELMRLFDTTTGKALQTFFTGGHVLTVD